MIDPYLFLDLLESHELSFFAGVPDSLLKELGVALEKRNLGITCANEGNAVALAAGYHLATGKIGVCYFQNSGLGNAYSPLLSLTHRQVYSIPVLLLVGWRGEPGTEDEPQHVAQGDATLSTLDLLGINHAVLPAETDRVAEAVKQAVKQMTDRSCPYALVVRKATFSACARESETSGEDLLTREEALGVLLSVLPDDALVVSSTGKLSRELFEFRAARGQDHRRNFLTVGSMGHASSIALGVAMYQPDRPVFCLDGDGAALMHLGALATIGTSGPANYKHVIFNNGAHDSVGGQATVGLKINFPAIAGACRYRACRQARSQAELHQAVTKLLSDPGPALLEIRVRKGARENLGRPTSGPPENKSEFMKGMS